MRKEEVQQMVEEWVDNLEPFWKQSVATIVEKIIKMPYNEETTIASLLGYTNEDVSQVDPLTQGMIFQKSMEVCEKLNIQIEEIRDCIGGLAYHSPFKKSV